MKKVIIVFFSFILLLSGCDKRIEHPYIKEYIPGTGNIKANVDVKYFTDVDKVFDIGADEDGVAVFKKPYKAFDKLNELYYDEIKILQNQYNLKPLKKDSYDGYMNFAYQYPTTDEDVKEKMKFIGSFFDIYENSFRE